MIKNLEKYRRCEDCGELNEFVEDYLIIESHTGYSHNVSVCRNCIELRQDEASSENLEIVNISIIRRD